MSSLCHRRNGIDVNDVTLYDEKIEDKVRRLKYAAKFIFPFCVCGYASGNTAF